MNFGGCQPTWSKAFVVISSFMRLTISTGICQQELFKVLAWQVSSDRGIVDIGKNYKYLFNYLPAEKEKEFSNLLDLSSLDKITQSLFATMKLFDREAQESGSKDGLYVR